MFLFLTTALVTTGWVGYSAYRNRDEVPKITGSFLDFVLDAPMLAYHRVRYELSGEREMEMEIWARDRAEQLYRDRYERRREVEMRLQAERDAAKAAAEARLANLIKHEPVVAPGHHVGTATIIIDDHQYNGVSSLEIKSDMLIINGVHQEQVLVNKKITVEIVDGTLDHLYVENGDVECGDINGNVKAVSVNAGEIHGNVEAQGRVHASDIGGDVAAGDNVDCGEISGSVTAQGNVSCYDVSESITAGGDINCGGVGGNVTGRNIDCAEVDGDVIASGDVDSSSVGGNVSGRDVSCGEVEGDVTATGNVDCGDVSGSIRAGSVNAG